MMEVHLWTPPVSIICINEGCNRVYTTRSNRFTCSLECAAAITQRKEAKRQQRELGKVAI